MNLSIDEIKSTLLDFELQNRCSYLKLGVDFCACIEEDLQNINEGFLGVFKKKKEYDYLMASGEGFNKNEKISVMKELLEYKNRISIVLCDNVIFFDDKFFFSKSLKAFSKVEGEKNVWGYEEVYSLDEIFNLDWSEINYPDETVHEIYLKKYLRAQYLGPHFRIPDQAKPLVQLLVQQLQRAVEKKNEENISSRRLVIAEELNVLEGGVLQIESTNSLEMMLREYQQKIIQIDRSYVQNFVKTIQFLKSKKETIENIYQFIGSTSNLQNLDQLYDLLKDEKYRYELILLHSLTMLSSLVDDDMITFYEVYELFDKYRIFDSEWQRETTKQLADIDASIKSMEASLSRILIEILHQSQRMEASIVGAIGRLTYVTGSSMALMTSSVNAKLASIDSKLSTANLLNSIQIYQSHKLLKR